MKHKRATAGLLLLVILTIAGVVLAQHSHLTPDWKHPLAVNIIFYAMTH